VTHRDPMVIDFHARLRAGSGAAQRLLEVMDEQGIAAAVVTAGGVIDIDRLALQIAVGGHVTGDADNAAVLRAAVASGGRLIPFFFGNPHRGAGPYREVAHQVHGLELSPAVHGVDFDDTRTIEMVATAEAAGHPVYVVCLPRPGVSVPDLAVLAGKFPAVTFVLGHSGVSAVDLYGLDMVGPCPNVMVETSCTLSITVASAIERLGSSRVLFGTEYPHQHPSVELTKIAALRLSPEVKSQVLSGNARRLLRMPGISQGGNTA
jgi:uncharacterized protein